MVDNTDNQIPVPEYPQLKGWKLKLQLKLLRQQLSRLRKKVHKLITSDKEELAREKMINSILDLKMVFNMADEEGNEVTEENLRKRTTEELIIFFEEMLKLLQKTI